MGYTVTKKNGNAVERNRIRRRFREAVRLADLPTRPGYDYVMIGRRAALSIPFDNLMAQLGESLHMIHQRADKQHTNTRHSSPAPSA